MKFSLIVLFALISAITAGGARAEHAERSYFVPQCRYAAHVAALLAKNYPSDEQKRSDSFAIILDSSTNFESPRATKLDQMNAAFIVMEAIVKSRGGKMSPEALRDDVIAESAATCMAVSLARQTD